MICTTLVVNYGSGITPGAGDHDIVCELEIIMILSVCGLQVGHILIIKGTLISLSHFLLWEELCCIYSYIT